MSAAQHLRPCSLLDHPSPQPPSSVLSSRLKRDVFVSDHQAPAVRPSCGMVRYDPLPRDSSLLDCNHRSSDGVGLTLQPYVRVFSRAASPSATVLSQYSRPPCLTNTYSPRWLRLPATVCTNHHIPANYARQTDLFSAVRVELTLPNHRTSPTISVVRHRLPCLC